MSDISKLLEVMRRLRDPPGGCPWDLQQDFQSIAPYTIEEAYEVADAIERGELSELKDELGDLLFQVVYHAHMAEERGAFRFDEVVGAICEKLIRRHPHVFGDQKIADASAQTRAWEAHKDREKRSRRHEIGATGHCGALSDVPLALPALTRAAKLGRRASRTGFDWPNADGPRAKIDEELRELDREMGSGGDKQRVEHEAGDALFAVVNLCRHLDIDPEKALRSANSRFQRRFEFVERALAQQGRQAGDASLEEMDGLWEQAKAQGL